MASNDALFRACKRAAHEAISSVYFPTLPGFDDRVNALAHRLLAACEEEQKKLMDKQDDVT